MNRVTPEFDFVKIPDPGEGDPMAEEAATLLLQGIQRISRPTKEQIGHTVTTEIDGTIAFAALSSEGSVIGTGGLLLIEPSKIRRAAIVNMAVASSERGQGLGTSIMSRLEEEAARLNVREVFGQPEPQYLNFYEQFGYKKSKVFRIAGEVLIKPL
jgi:N-acetylglutamate synthase-like GNAT family acetyltransferase